jgi:hypothetical protein
MFWFMEKWDEFINSIARAFFCVLIVWGAGALTFIALELLLLLIAFFSLEDLFSYFNGYRESFYSSEILVKHLIIIFLGLIPVSIIQYRELCWHKKWYMEEIKRSLERDKKYEKDDQKE